jgi:hypothetical protein
MTEVLRGDAVLLVTSYTTGPEGQCLLNISLHCVCRDILFPTVGLTARPGATVSSMKDFDSNQRIGNIRPIIDYEHMLRVYNVHISSRHSARCLRPIIGCDG